MGSIVEVLTPGVVNAIKRLPQHRTCSRCAFPLPRYRGRYPKSCPGCAHGYDALPPASTESEASPFEQVFSRIETLLLDGSEAWSRYWEDCLEDLDDISYGLVGREHLLDWLQGALQDADAILDEEEALRAREFLSREIPRLSDSLPPDPDDSPDDSTPLAEVIRKIFHKIGGTRSKAPNPNRRMAARKAARRGKSKRMAALRRWRSSPRAKKMYKALSKWKRVNASVESLLRLESTPMQAVQTVQKDPEDVINEILLQVNALELLEYFEDIDYDDEEDLYYLFFSNEVTSLTLDKFLEALRPSYPSTQIVQNPETETLAEEDNYWIVIVSDSPIAQTQEDPLSGVVDVKPSGEAPSNDPLSGEVEIVSGMALCTTCGNICEVLEEAATIQCPKCGTEFELQAVMKDGDEEKKDQDQDQNQDQDQTPPQAPQNPPQPQQASVYRCSDCDEAFIRLCEDGLMCPKCDSANVQMSGQSIDDVVREAIESGRADSLLDMIG